MYCGKCGAQNADTVSFCQKCGAPINQAAPVPPRAPQAAPAKKKNKGCLIASLITLGVALVIIAGIGVSCVAALASYTSTPTAPPLSRDTFVSTCVEMDYEQFARQPNENREKPVMFTGEIIQVMGEKSLDMRIALRAATDSYADYDRIVYVQYDMPEGSPRMLEGDVVTVYGISKGNKTYSALLGNEVTLPLVAGKFIDVISTDTAAATAAVFDGEGSIGEYKLKILSISKVKEYDGKPAVVVVIEWENNSNEAEAYNYAFDTTVYQNGVELDTAYLPSDTKVDVDAKQNKVQPGVKQTVYCAFELKDASRITVEITASFGFKNQSKVIKEFDIQ